MKSRQIIHINKIAVESIHNLTNLVIVLLLEIICPFLRKKIILKECDVLTFINEFNNLYVNVMI